MSHPPSTGDARILLLEDDDDVRLSFSILLEEYLRRPVTALATCAETRAYIRTERYALVILDVRLRDGSGLELIPTVRALQPEAKVVLLSGLDGDALPASLVDAFFLKGDDPVRILERLRALVPLPTAAG
jgi:DNA-binding NarL/FixJ family response regulator